MSRTKSILPNQFAALGTLMQDRMEDRFGDLSPRAAAVLITLLNRGALTVSRLAAIAGTSQPTATRLVDGMEARSLIKRGEREGREVAVSLTPAGRRRAKALRDTRAELAAELLGPLDAGERRQLGGLIDKILHGATASRAVARTTCRYCDHSVCGGAACPVNRRATEIESAIERDAQL